MDLNKMNELAKRRICEAADALERASQAVIVADDRRAAACDAYDAACDALQRALDEYREAADALDAVENGVAE